MTTGLPGSGVISFANISVEILRSSTSQRSLNDADVRTLLGVPSGQISISTAYGKRWVTPGNNSFSYTGSTQYFSVPRYETLTVTINAGGGGATGYCDNDGFAYGYCGGAGASGGNTTFYSSNNVIANGGTGGGGGGQDYCPPSGAAGGGSGGTVTSGGGAGGGTGCNSGGAGGKVVKTWNWNDADAPGYGASIAISIGAGGGGGGGGENAPAASGGGNGSVYIEWT